MKSGAALTLVDTPPVSQGRTVPFEYAFRYDLRGKRGEVHNRTVAVSIEGPFVAVSIGYGVVPKVNAITFGPTAPSDYQGPSGPHFLKKPGPGVATIFTQLSPPLPVADIPLFSVLAALTRTLSKSATAIKGATGPEAAFIHGFRINPQIAEVILQGVGVVPPPPLSVDQLDRLFEIIAAPPEQIQFKYALFDQGTGREYQSEPILNTAGLGSSDGVRPFRYFAVPIHFAPQTTIRLEVTEVSEFQGELHVALHGYKALGTSGSPTAAARVEARASMAKMTRWTGDRMHQPRECDLDASSALCAQCGIPLDSQFFDASGVDAVPPNAGERVVLARFELPPQHCGVLQFFAQYTDLQSSLPANIETPGLEWLLTSNKHPLYPYLAFRHIVNPWGYGSFPINIRLDEGAVVEFAVRRIADNVGTTNRVGARIVGRFWYNPAYGDAAGH